MKLNFFAIFTFALNRIASESPGWNDYPSKQRRLEEQAYIFHEQGLVEINGNPFEGINKKCHSKRPSLMGLNKSMQ